MHQVVREALGKSETKTSKQWKLLGRPLGPKCLCTLMGIGNDRLQHAIDGKVDTRYAMFGAAARLSCFLPGRDVPR